MYIHAHILYIFRNAFLCISYWKRLWLMRTVSVLYKCMDTIYWQMQYYIACIFALIFAHINEHARIRIRPCVHSYVYTSTHTRLEARMRLKLETSRYWLRASAAELSLAQYLFPHWTNIALHGAGATAELVRFLGLFRSTIRCYACVWA